MTAIAPGDPMTERQRLVLSFIVKHRAEHGFSPTIREIGQHLGIRSTNGVNDHLRALAKRGLIQLGEGKSRATVVLSADPAAPITDGEALAHIARLLAGDHDDASTIVDEVARMVRLSGRHVPSVDDPDGGGCPVGDPDCDGPDDGSHDACEPPPDGA